MRRLFFTCGVILAVSACASTPVLEPYSPAGLVGPHGTVWADNGTDYFLMIRKIDGKSTPSRGGSGYPYSTRLSAGEHRLSVYVSNLSLSNGNVFISHYANTEIAIDVEEGHSYALKLSPSRTHAIVDVIDLGNVLCSHDIAGHMSRGYVPVALNCK